MCKQTELRPPALDACVKTRTGSISIDTSAIALRAKRVRSASRMRPTSGGGTSDGVPPPKNTLDSGAAPAAVCTCVGYRPGAR